MQNKNILNKTMNYWYWIKIKDVDWWVSYLLAEDRWYLEHSGSRKKQES